MTVTATHNMGANDAPDLSTSNCFYIVMSAWLPSSWSRQTNPYIQHTPLTLKEPRLQWPFPTNWLHVMLSVWLHPSPPPGPLPHTPHKYHWSSRQSMNGMCPAGMYLNPLELGPAFNAWPWPVWMEPTTHPTHIPTHTVHLDKGSYIGDVK